MDIAGQQLNELPHYILIAAHELFECLARNAGYLAGLEGLGIFLVGNTLKHGRIAEELAGLADCSDQVFAVLIGAVELHLSSAEVKESICLVPFRINAFL